MDLRVCNAGFRSFRFWERKIVITSELAQKAIDNETQRARNGEMARGLKQKRKKAGLGEDRAGLGTR